MSLELALILAVLAQGGLIFGLIFWLGSKRLPLVEARKIQVADIALSREPWPEDATKAANALDNQFQLPLLLFAAVAISVYLGPSWLDVALAWAFVASRVVHALIHVTTNQVYHRFYAYMTGLMIILAWWLLLTLRVAIALFGGF